VEGSVHGFTMLRAKDRSRVPGWDFGLKPGMQEFTATASKEPGTTLSYARLICSPNHDQMNMKVIVVPGIVIPNAYIRRGVSVSSMHRLMSPPSV